MKRKLSPWCKEVKKTLIDRDVTENLVPLEHVVSEIHSAGSGEEQIELLSENIMLYVKEFGNLTKSNATIDNEYIGKFLDDLRKEFGY